MSKKNRKKGFTLLELIGSIVILAIITMIAVPAVSNRTKKASIDTTMSSFKILIGQINKNGTFEDYYSKVSVDNGIGLKYFSTDNDIFSKTVTGQYPDSGIIVINTKNKVQQAKVCYDNLSYEYDSSTNTYKHYNNSNFCNYVTEQINGINYLSTTGILDQSNSLYGIISIDNSINDHGTTPFIVPASESDTGKEIIYGTGLARSPIIFNLPEGYSYDINKTSRTLVNPKLKKLASYQSSFSYNPEVKDQGQLNLCWAYATTSLVENKYKLKNNIDISTKVSSLNLSERQLDYYAASNAVTNYKNPFAYTYNKGISRKLNEGIENTADPVRFLFSGMLYQSESSFDNNSDIKSLLNSTDSNGKPTPKSLSKSSYVFDKDKVSYYVPSAQGISIYNSFVYKNFDSMKNAIRNNGGLTIGICANWIKAYSKDGKSIGIIDSRQSNYSLQNCISHEVYLIGWNDSTITFEGNTIKGYWIARNSWGNTKSKSFPTIYIDYNFNGIAMTSNAGLTVLDVREKDFDNIYTTYKDNESLNVGGNNFNYFTRNVNYSEKVYGFSLLNFGSIEYGVDNGKTFIKYGAPISTNVKIIDVKDVNECKKIASGGSYDSSKSINVAYSTPEMSYKTVYTNSSYNFQNNICVLTNKPVTLYTKKGTTTTPSTPSQVPNNSTSNNNTKNDSQNSGSGSKNPFSVVTDFIKRIVSMLRNAFNRANS